MDQSTGRGRVLVMESDGLIRNLVSLMLRTAGYQVDSAATGAEALHKLRRLPPALAVIGLGEVLAGGWQLLEALRQAPSRRRSSRSPRFTNAAPRSAPAQPPASPCRSRLRSC